MKKVAFLLICILVTRFSSAQEVYTDKTALLTHIQYEETARGKDKYVVKMQFSYNPIKLILFVPLYFYQKLVAEQVSAICEFEPSCSNFGLQSLKQLGLIKGLFLTADRLTRCNGEAQPEAQYYLIDHHSGKVIDEPRMYKVKD